MLISPRGGPAGFTDLGERSALVAGQRVGRVRRHRRLRLRRLGRAVALAALPLAALAGLALGGRWALTTPRFAVATIEVRGASRVPPAEIVAASSIRPGVNLWTIDTARAALAVAGLPQIRRAEIVRELPGRVTIVVEERRPFTLVHAERLHWVDEEGRVLGQAREAVVPPVPVISGLTEAELETLSTTPGPKARAAIAVIRALLRSGSTLTQEISEIDMSRGEGPVLYTVDGVEVRLGREEWEDRLARLEGVLAQVTTKNVRTVDLRFRDQVVLQGGDAR